MITFKQRTGATLALAALMGLGFATAEARHPNKSLPQVDPSYGGGEFRWPWEAGGQTGERGVLQPTETLLLETTEDALGNDIAYPTTGDARVTATVLTLGPGQRSNVLQHETPMFAYVLEGRVTLNYGRNGFKAFKAGESMLQPMNRPFRTINDGDGTAKLLLVSMGAKGAPRAKVVQE